jgi:hypothetical protein
MEAITVYTNVNTLAFERPKCMCHAERTYKGNKKCWLEKSSLGGAEGRKEFEDKFGEL